MGEEVMVHLGLWLDPIEIVFIGGVMAANIRSEPKPPIFPSTKLLLPGLWPENIQLHSFHQGVAPI